MEAIDCGDTSCEFAEEKTGQRTNGGCRCLKDLDPMRRMAAHAYIKALREENVRLRQRVERPLDVEHTTSCGHTWTLRHTACPECFAALRQRVAELEREKYGTPCRCEQWVKACGEAEERVEVLEQTSGDLCDVCGWRTVIAGVCVKCAGEQAEAKVACGREE